MQPMAWLRHVAHDLLTVLVRRQIGLHWVDQPPARHYSPACRGITHEHVITPSRRSFVQRSLRPTRLDQVPGTCRRKVGNVLRQRLLRGGIWTIRNIVVVVKETGVEAFREIGGWHAELLSL